ncbi:CGNR zinc finger domain-containing protein [Pseudonocardia spinosispora]|uniref:CGNR zinc finger domain-containing protein n=1 Tax=Pseudonocardia spinosispora TaxID=103441 RepID=UPI000413527B|nr:CGNR zinc finger domain-containing protein [Pseudonocardia spinosispora]
MDFIGYRSDALGMAVDLVNALRDEPRPAVPELVAEHRYLVDQPWGAEHDQVLWDWAARLRDVFAATDMSTLAELINALLADAVVTPHLSSHDGQPWHLHYSRPHADTTERVKATTAFAMATLVSTHGMDRHGECSAEGCGRVYADTSRNARRRYCSAACANRSAVAAHRARRRGTLERDQLAQ